MCATINLVTDMEIAKSVTERLLGPNSISDKKSRSGRLLDWIGWEINLDLRTVSIANHNLYKTLYGFFKLEYKERITVKEVQRLASWASRYALVCRFMRPFTFYLYNAITGRTHSQALVTMEGPLWLSVQLWQIFLIMSKLRPETYAKKIDSYRAKRGVGIWLSYDASLTGLGVILRTVNPLDQVSPYVGVVSVLSIDTPYELKGDSAFQNTMEFIAIVMGMFHMYWLGYRDTEVHIVGDNTSSLHWCDKERFRGGKSNGPAIAFILQAFTSRNEITLSLFIKGIDNVHCDKLSRGIRPKALMYPAKVCWRFPKTGIAVDLITLLDPRIEHMMDTALVSLWTAVQKLLGFPTYPTSGHPGVY